jgi:hypothetical protein
VNLTTKNVLSKNDFFWKFFKALNIVLSKSYNYFVSLTIARIFCLGFFKFYTDIMVREKKITHSIRLETSSNTKYILHWHSAPCFPISIYMHLSLPTNTTKSLLFYYILLPHIISYMHLINYSYIWPKEPYFVTMVYRETGEGVLIKSSKGCATNTTYFIQELSLIFNSLSYAIQEYHARNRPII